MPALQQFFEAERLRQGWSMREAAKRCNISPSKAYAIANGDDNVEFETFENIAAAFKMSPAELAVAIGKGPAEENPKRAPLHALIRQVPDDKLDTVDLIVRPFAVVPPTSRAANRRQGAETKRGRAALRNLDSAQTDHPETGPSDGLRKWYEHPGVLATFLNLLSPAALVPSAAS